MVPPDRARTSLSLLPLSSHFLLDVLLLPRLPPSLPLSLSVRLTPRSSSLLHSFSFPPLASTAQQQYCVNDTKQNLERARGPIRIRVGP